MPESPEDLANRLRELTRPGARSRLVAKGLARGFIWRNGILPEETPTFDDQLTPDLLDHAFDLLSLALRLRETEQHLDIASKALLVAAEALESVARRGNPEEPERGFLLVVASASFHIAGFSARAYCLLEGDLTTLNISSAERVLTFLMRRDLRALRDQCYLWLRDEAHQDAALAQRLANAEDDFNEDDLISIGITRDVHRSLALFDEALIGGDREVLATAQELMHKTVGLAEESRNVPLWWITTLALHVMDDLWGNSLHERLPQLPADDPSAEAWLHARRSYLALLASRKAAEVDLWPSQLQAASRSIDPTDDLVVALPTSAGKTRIAELCILRALSMGARVIYVTPLRALSAQVERTLGQTFRPLGYTVSSLYGASGVSAVDVAALAADNIVVATPEKLDFAIRQDPSVINDVTLIVLDEGHMIGVGTREIRYEVLVQRLLARADATSRRIVCLSAIFSSGQAFNDFTAWLRSDAPGSPVHEPWRPTRQRPGVLTRTITPEGNAARLALEIDGEGPYVPRFIRPTPPQGGRSTSFPNNPNEMVIAAAKALATEKQRVLIYCPMRKSVEGLAKICITLNGQGLLPSLLDDTSAISRALFIGKEWLGPNHVAVKALRLGIAVHHGELPRPFLAEIEQLLNDRILKITIASPTVAQGLDLSCSTLVLHSLSRGRTPMPATEFANVIGRAGRAFVDLDGLTLYPIFDVGRFRSWKIHKFLALWEAAKSRTMESGIVLLIGTLLNKIQAHIGGSSPELLEYVLNEHSDWEIPDAEDGEGDEGKFDRLLADLDNTILATIERLDCDVTEVADLLDAALQSSLWKRRLEAQTEATRSIQRETLVGRARWIWNHTQPEQRKGYFSAGIGFRAGDHIQQHLEELLSGLAAADEALLENDLSTASVHLIRVAERLLETRPFSIRQQDLPASWREIITQWVGGVPLERMIREHGKKTVGFVQNGLVFRLVWGIEAVRVHAQAVGDSRADRLSGVLPLALTYGLPNIRAILMVQAGLPSRTMALSITSQVTTEYSTMGGLNSWLHAVAGTFNIAELWPSPNEQAIWQTFMSRWSMRTDADWQWTRSVKQVTWEVTPPPAGKLVRIVRDAAANAMKVMTLDYTPLGRLTEANVSTDGHMIVRVGTEPNSVSLERFSNDRASQAIAY